MMRSRYLISLVVAVATPAFAASPIDGTWKTDLSSIQFTDKPDVLLLKGGTYVCSSCAPLFSVKADGAFHKLVGIPYIDEASVKVIDANTVEEVDKLKGKIVSTQRTSLSPDGKTLSIHWTDSSAPDGTVSRGDATQTRIAEGPVGSHAISGSWRTANVANISDAVATMVLATDGDILSMKTPNGYRYDAKLGGAPAAIIGDNADTKASVRKVGDSYEETDWRDGKIVSVYTMTPTTDGKLKIVSENKLRGTTTTLMMVRQ
jgi:hypothetical protein